MADFDAIAESLKQHRRDLEEQSDQTANRSSETARILAKIEDLRRRAEITNRAFPGFPAPGETEKK